MGPHRDYRSGSLRASCRVSTCPFWEMQTQDSLPDESGRLYLVTDLGVGLMHSADMALAAVLDGNQILDLSETMTNGFCSGMAFVGSFSKRVTNSARYSSAALRVCPTTAGTA